MHADLSVGGALHCVECEGRPQELAADSLEALAVPAVHGNGGVQKKLQDAFKKAAPPLFPGQVID